MNTSSSNELEVKDYYPTLSGGSSPKYVVVSANVNPARRKRACVVVDDNPGDYHFLLQKLVRERICDVAMTVPFTHEAMGLLSGKEVVLGSRLDTTPFSYKLDKPRLAVLVLDQKGSPGNKYRAEVEEDAGIVFYEDLPSFIKSNRTVFVSRDETRLIKLKLSNPELMIVKDKRLDLDQGGLDETTVAYVTQLIRTVQEEVIQNQFLFLNGGSYRIVFDGGDPIVVPRGAGTFYLHLLLHRAQHSTNRVISGLVLQELWQEFGKSGAAITAISKRCDELEQALWAGEMPRKSQNSSDGVTNDEQSVAESLYDMKDNPADPTMQETQLGDQEGEFNPTAEEADFTVDQMASVSELEKGTFRIGHFRKEQASGDFYELREVLRGRWEAINKERRGLEARLTGALLPSERAALRRTISQTDTLVEQIGKELGELARTYFRNTDYGKAGSSVRLAVKREVSSKREDSANDAKALRNLHGQLADHLDTWTTLGVSCMYKNVEEYWKTC